MKRVLIAGIGNVSLGDDGAGPRLVRLLQARYDFAPGVDVVDCGTPSLNFVDRLAGRDALIALDADANGEPSGAVTLYRREDLLGKVPPRLDPHSPSLSESILLAEAMGFPLRDILLVGISGEHYRPGVGLSRAVEDSLDLAVWEVLRELDRLGVAYSARLDDPEAAARSHDRVAELV